MKDLKTDPSWYNRKWKTQILVRTNHQFPNKNATFFFKDPWRHVFCQCCSNKKWQTHPHLAIATLHPSPPAGWHIDCSVQAYMSLPVMHWIYPHPHPAYNRHHQNWLTLFSNSLCTVASWVGVDILIPLKPWSDMTPGMTQVTMISLTCYWNFIAKKSSQMGHGGTIIFLGQSAPTTFHFGLALNGNHCPKHSRITNIEPLFQSPTILPDKLFHAFVYQNILTVIFGNKNNVSGAGRTRLGSCSPHKDSIQV